MTSVRKATLLSLAQRYVAFVVQLGSSIILARLLTPAETGIYSLAAAVIGLAQMLRDFGIGEYVMQARDMSEQRLRSVLGASSAIAWTIAALLLLAAGPVATHYGEPGVKSVILVLALNFVLLPIGTTTFAMLTKEMAYKEIFIVQTSSVVVGAALSLGMAWLGYSYMSLAWSSVLSTVTTIVILGFLRPAQTFMRPSFKGLGEIGRFGGALTLGRFVDQISRRAPDLLIAQNLGFHAVGINSKAVSLLDAFHDFFFSGISRVATPAFARNRHADGDASKSYLDATGLLVIVPLAFFSLISLLAEPIVRGLFGTAWLEAVPLLRIGAVGGLLSAPYFLAPPILTAHGRVKSILTIQIVGGAVFLPLLYLASHHSLVAVALVGVVAVAVKLVIMQRALQQSIGLGPRALLGSCGRSVLIATVAVLATWPVLLIYDGSAWGALLVLGLAGLTAGTGLLGGILVFRHPLSAELSKFWQQRKAATRAPSP